MILAAAQPPHHHHHHHFAQDYNHRRQRPGFDLDAHSPRSALAVSLTSDDSQASPFLSKFNASLAVPFAGDSFPQEDDNHEASSSSSSSYMHTNTQDFYTPNRSTQQAAPRSASSQAQSNGVESQALEQWYPLGGPAAQSHLAPSASARPRFHGQLAGHKRNNSGSTVTSTVASTTGPSSPFTPVVGSYPHIHDPEQHFASPLVEGFDLSHQQHYAKPLPPNQPATFSDSFLGPGGYTAHYPQQQQQQQQHQQQQQTTHGDPNLHYQLAMRRAAMMSQDTNSSSGGGGGGASVPSLQRMPTSEFERDYKATVEGRGSVPRLDRTLSDIYQDELFDPGTAAPVQQQQQQQQQQQTTVARPLSNSQQGTGSPHRDVFSERLAAASNGHLSARSGTPSTANLSRDRSPFQPTSEYAHDEILAAHAPSPARRLGSVAQMRQQQQQQQVEYAAQQQRRRQQQQRRSLEESRTISPKELLEPAEAEAEAMPSLFPTETQMQAYAQQQVPVERQRQNSQQQQQQQQMLQPYPFASSQRSDATNPEFHPQLTSMESTRSGGTASSRSSVDDGELPQRPDHTLADTGSYPCSAPGCAQRFDSAGRLQRHRRDAHRTPSPPLLHRPSAIAVGGAFADTDQTGSPTGAALAARNSQPGPHKCDRINPSTGKPCNSIFSRPYDLTRHEDTIHNNRKMKVRCRFCTEDKTFSRSDALTRHMRVVHPEMEVAGKRGRRG